MTPNEKTICVIVGLLMALITFVLINVAFSTPLLPSLASDTLVFQGLYFENRVQNL